MPVIQSSITVPANSALDNVLSGSQFEYLPWDAAVEFGLSGGAPGVLADVYSGQDVLAEAMFLPATNRVPIRPDDFTLTDVAGGGERLKIRLRNTTGAGITCFWSVIITPI
jgi:hypothetical protein